MSYFLVLIIDWVITVNNMQSPKAKQSCLYSLGITFSPGGPGIPIPGSPAAPLSPFCPSSPLNPGCPGIPISPLVPFGPDAPMQTQRQANEI